MAAPTIKLDIAVNGELAKDKPIRFGNGLFAWTMTAEEARTFAADLTLAADTVDRVTGEGATALRE